ncbi:MAG: glycosyltransferase family 2 protein [Deltaproteobacteria bacterium]|nr:glycosyltransferase family 2 protein [Deltaproteobacteria bacterium]
MSEMNIVTKRDRPDSLVSVVVPTFNRAGRIAAALDSIFDQNYRPIELLVVDDGSTDDTKTILEKWANQHRSADFQVRLIWNEHGGAPAARNSGMRMASGEFIQFADSDDRLLPGKIALQVEQMHETGVDMAVCDYFWMDEDGNILHEHRNDGDLKKKVSRHDSVFIMTPLVRLAKIRGVVWWDEKMPWCQDMDFFLKVFLVIDTYVHTPGMYCQYNIHREHQLSDKRFGSMPPYGRRIYSLLQFSWEHRNDLDRDAKRMAVTAAAFLAKDAVLFTPRKRMRARFPSMIPIVQEAKKMARRVLGIGDP